MAEWVGWMSSSANGTGKTESSDDEFGILEDDRCIDTGLPAAISCRGSHTQLRYPESSRVVCSKDSSFVRKGSLAGCRDFERGARVI